MVYKLSEKISKGIRSVGVHIWEGFRIGWCRISLGNDCIVTWTRVLSDNVVVHVYRADSHGAVNKRAFQANGLSPASVYV